jgi:glycosyltransferase involved in cell wall biosynthesis
MRIAIIHYSAPPVVGGVESVIQAHARLLCDAGNSVMVLAGDGDDHSLPAGTDFVMIPELGTRHPDIMQASLELEKRHVPLNFDRLVSKIESSLTPVLQSVDRVIVHNIFTKHFNLPLTVALSNLIDKGKLQSCIAWCHDFSWTSPHSRSKVFPGHPWDLLRTPRQDVHYVTVSQSRRKELSGLLGIPAESIDVIYNGVDPQEVLGLSESGMVLSDRLGLWKADLILLMPVRVTQAKNIELAIRLAAALKKLCIRPKLILTGPPDPHDQNNISYFQDLLALRHEQNVDQEMLFVYEAGPDANQPLIVDMKVVGDLYRISDALFMPSHREGFGMPILEAGLTGIPIFCTQIPAAVEIGGQDTIIISPESDPHEIAELVMDWAMHSPVWRLRRRVRQNLTWQAIFQQAIMPLLRKDVP